MNVLAPVAHNGRLQPKFDATLKIAGFQAGEFRVTGPETRKRAMHDRVGGSTCPWLTLAEVQSRDSASLKLAVARASLVVVHSEEIDKAGEKGVGPTVFDTVMRQLRAAWRLLLRRWGEALRVHERPRLLAARRQCARGAAARPQDRPEAPARLLERGCRPHRRSARGAQRPRLRRCERALDVPGDHGSVRQGRPKP
jgi:hypothetical protein